MIIQLLEDATIDAGDVNGTDNTASTTSSSSGGVAVGAMRTQFACSSCKDNIALIFNRLVWCLKLLTLDQVGDVIKYHIPMKVSKYSTVTAVGDSSFEVIRDDVHHDNWHTHSFTQSLCFEQGGTRTGSASTSIGSVLFSDPMVRCILSKRVEFSKDHIAKIKLRSLDER